MCLELAAVRKSFAALFAFKWFLATVATLMTFECCLSGEGFATYRASEVLIYMKC
jgi:hypothetical protein